MGSRTEVLGTDPPRFLRTRFGTWLLAGESMARFEAEGKGTRIDQEFRTSGGVIPGIMGRIFAMGSYRGSFQVECFDRQRQASGQRT